MSYPTFVICLTGYLLLVAMSFFLGSDESFRAAQKDKVLRFKNSKLIALTYVLCAFTALSIAIIGFTGLFFLWRTGAYLFFSAVVVRIIYDYGFDDELKMKGARGALAHFTVFVEFLLAGLIFFGPAKPLFH